MPEGALPRLVNHPMNAQPLQSGCAVPVGMKGCGPVSIESYGQNANNLVLMARTPEERDHGPDELMTYLPIRHRAMCAPLLFGVVLALSGTVASAAISPAKRLPYIDDNQQCRGQPLPATVEHLTGEAWKLDAKGRETALEEGMDIDEKEGVKTSPSAFVSLSLGDGSRVVLPSSSQVTLQLNNQYSIPQVVLQQGQIESYVIKRTSDHDRFQIVTPVGVLGVRGTHFRVRNDDEQALVEVLNGQVAVNRDEETPDKKPLRRGKQVVDKPAGPLPGEVQVMARQGMRIRKEGELKPVELLAAPRLLGQAGQMGPLPVWQLILEPLPGARRYRAQVATDKDFLNIKQEQFSSTPKVNFTGLQAFFYHVRLSAFDEHGLEGETGVYDIFYYPRNTRVQ